jgi:GT2 family glycosyltransferase
VSVVIPTFNRAYCILRAADSVIAQTSHDWELIIVDDGSTDDTRELVAKRYGSQQTVRYLHQDNAGVCAARNKGIAAAQGEFVAFLDSDDVWEPWKLELQVAALRRCPELGMVWTDMAAVDPQGKVVHERYLKTMYAAYRWFRTEDLFTRSYPISDVAPGLAHLFPNSRLWTGEIFSQMITGNLVQTSTVVIRRECLNRVGGFNVDLKRSGEDFDFHLRTCREGPVGFVDVSSIRYQIGMPDQLTAPSYSEDLARNFLNTIEPAIQKDRDKIRLPEETIRSTLAYGHSWLGEQLLLKGSAAEARRHLLESMRRRTCLRVMGLYLLSFLPNAGIDLLRTLWRMLRALRAKRTVLTTLLIPLVANWSSAVELVVLTQ